MGVLAEWGEPLLDFLLPPACAGCRNTLAAAPGPRDSSGGGRERPRICPRCLTRLRAPPHPQCPRCAAPRGTGLPEDRPCTECRDWPPILRSARSVALLVDPADALVHALKYGGWPELGEELARRMAHVPLPGLPDLAGVPIVPVPTTLRRLRDRGYNQAGVLAATVARATGGILLEALSRMEGGESQVALHPDERRANVKGAFLLRDSSAAEIRGRDILLVDDVLTTGATAVAAAETLGAGGARSVTLLTFARALPG